MISRRRFLRLGALFSAGLFLPWDAVRQLEAAGILPHIKKKVQELQESGTILDSAGISKYVTPLINPPAMPMAGQIKDKGKKIDFYEIAVRQFDQQILPPGMPATTVWGYGSIHDPATFHYPSFTIEATVKKPVRVRWINQLVDEQGNYLPHLLPVDPTLHWANPPGGHMGRDMRPTFEGETPGAYTGPVPFVTHVHGAHTAEQFDGHAEAWYLPAANNIPEGYAATGTFYDYFQSYALKGTGITWQAGEATFQYPNDQPATTLWYHDHVLGMTRLNVYAGPAGFYLIRGALYDLFKGLLPNGAYEIPIVVQDRTFNSDGSLFYPDTRAFFDGYEGPYIPETEISPIWNPEFFGTAMVVNGRTWPMQEVEQRRYRFRFLNGCNSRFLILKMVTETSTDTDTGATAPNPFAAAALQFHQIGAEGGFLPRPVALDTLLMGNAERADVIVDFSRVPVGTEIYLINIGPDEPFGGGVPGVDFEVSDPNTTGQVLKFVVKAAKKKDTSLPVNLLRLPAPKPLGKTSVTRQVSLNELMAHEIPGDMPVVAALQGLVEFDGEGNPSGVPLEWHMPVTENPNKGAKETWEIYNFTEDAHPIHLHQVTFNVVNRQPFGGTPRPPEPWEAGYKDTVIAYPGEITRIKAFFDLKGVFVWHCHIVEHEDNEMMRQFYVGKMPKDFPGMGH